MTGAARRPAIPAVPSGATARRRPSLAPTPFADRSWPLQLLLAGGVPLATGGLQGWLVGISSAGYLAMAVLAALGGFGHGFEHPDARTGAARGVVGGTLFGTALVVTHALVGTHAKVTLGSSPLLFVLISAVIGMLLGSAGGHVGRHLRTRAEAARTGRG